MYQQGSGSSFSFAVRRANYLARQGQAQPLSGGAGVAANDPKATSGEEAIVVDSKEPPTKKQ